MKRLGAPTLLLVLAALVLPGGVGAEQSSQPSSPAAGHLSAGGAHNCAVLSGAVRCWGFGGNGRLGLASTITIGDDETPAAVAPLAIGAVDALSAGDGHTCAVLADDTLRCWGFGGNGRLGYGNLTSIGDDESPGAAGPVPVGAGRTARAVSAGDSHTCAILDDGTVRCWGYGAAGQLGYANGEFVGDVLIGQDVGDDETPGSVAPVDLGAGRTAKAISAGESHTCAILDDDTVRCWGYGAFGQLGNLSAANIGDDETPASKPPVDLGVDRKAIAITAGNHHTCALLDNGRVRCWGFGANGQLGYGTTTNIGDNESPASVGPVDLGPGRTAKAIAGGRQHTCALLDDDSVRCWGAASFGQLGYGNQTIIGDDETPAAVGPVDLGPGAKAISVSASRFHTCAQLADLSVRCWGYGANGRLGLCSETSIGDDETPASVGPVDLGAGGAGCPAPPGGGGGGGGGTTISGGPSAPAPGGGAGPTTTPPAVDPLAVEAARAQRMRACLRSAARGSRAARKRARRACLTRHGRTPGRVTDLRARAVSRTQVVLTFKAPGSNGSRPPAARAYLIRQAQRPIRSARDFGRAAALCRGSCRFQSLAMGARITLTVTGLRPRTTYYYAVAARDNVSNRTGPRSRVVRVRTR